MTRRRPLITALAAILVTCGEQVCAADATPPPTPARASGSARELFEQERELLRAEADAMRHARDRALAEARRSANAAEVTLRALRGEWAALLASSAELEEKTRQLARLAELEQGEVLRVRDLSSTAERAAEALRAYGITVAPTADPLTRLEQSFQAALDRLDRHSRVEIEAGGFFGHDGRWVEGHIARVGAVAALGAAPSGEGGILVPAEPGGTLRVLHSERDHASDTAARRAAEDLIRGTPPSLVPLFVFDPLDWHPVSFGSEETPSPPTRTWQETMKAAGPLGWPIAGLGALVLLLLLERCAVLAAWQWAWRRGQKSVDAAVARGTADALFQATARTAGAQRALLTAAERARELPAAAQSEALGGAVDSAATRLERGLPLFKVIAGSAPLLGLLGTVMGMIQTFDVLTLHGSGDAKLLSGGISQALLTTEFGLIVAVPALLAHSAMASWTDRLVDALETRAVEIVVLLQGERGKRLAPEAEQSIEEAQLVATGPLASTKHGRRP